MSGNGKCINVFSKRIEGRLHYDPVLKQTTDWYQIPCGKCTNCKIMKTKEWALRCCLELPYWEKSIFTTLTFRDEDMPKDGSLHKEILQKFFKDVRNDLRADGRKIKVLACGEYGDENFRCHYHAIIFGIGIDFNNSYQVIKNGQRMTAYRSENQILEKNWTYGNVFNGAVSYKSARYVASYVFKKYTGDLKKEIYDDMGLEQPFQSISNGIGKSFYNAHKNKIFKDGYIQFCGVKHSIPKYFTDLWIREDSGEFEKNFIHEKNLELQKQQHRLDEYTEWYEKYKRKIEIELGYDIDEDFRDNIDLIMKWQDEADAQRIANAKKAEHRNNLIKHKGA